MKIFFGFCESRKRQTQKRTGDATDEQNVESEEAHTEDNAEEAGGSEID